MSGTVWSKFYWSDWQSDQNLRLCSYAARGLWMDLLCIAAQSDTVGMVLINGKPPTTAILARLTGGTPEEVEILLRELEDNGVFTRLKNGTIVSRRMVKDGKRAQTARENGQKGGNPSLCNQRENSARDNPPDKPPDNPGDKGGDNTHKPIANSHIPENKKKEESSPPPDDGWPADAFDRFWKAYPNKVGKAAAQPKFDAIRRSRSVTWEAFWAGLMAYVNKRDDRPWCNPATWLYQRRWEDDPAVSAARRPAQARTSFYRA